MADDFVRVAAQGIVSLPDNTVTSAKIVDNAVTTTKVADGAINSAKIADDSIVNADINSSAAIDVSKLSGVVASSTVGNLLTAMESNFEGGVTGWVVDGTSAVTSDAAQYLVGSSSMRVDIGVTNAWGAKTITSNHPVVGGATYTAVASFKVGSGSRTTYRVVMNWYVNGVYNSQTLGTIVTPGAGWAESVASGTAPSNATHVQIMVQPTATGLITDTFYVDRVGLWRGTGGEWALPGSPIVGLADSAVTTAKIADSAVTSAKIADGAIVNADINASAAIDVSKLSGVVASATAGNILTTEESTFEGGTTGGWSGSHATLANSNLYAYSGTKSLAVTAVGDAAYGLASVVPTNIAAIPAGSNITVSAWVRPQNSPPADLTVRIFINTSIGQRTAVVQPVTALTAAAWTPIQATFNLANGETFSYINIIMYTATGGTVTYWDDIGVWVGSNGENTVPGKPIPGVNAVSPRTVGNMLTDNQAAGASILGAGQTTGFRAEANCTIARTSTYYLNNGASLEATVSADGAAYVSTTLTPTGTNDNNVAVIPGRVYTAFASIRSGTSSRTGFVSIYWLNAHGTFITQSPVAYYPPLSTTGFTDVLVSAVAPSTARYAAVVAGSSSTLTAGDKLYFGRFGFWGGAGGTWDMPGVPISNLGYYTEESVGRRIFHWDSLNNRFQTTYSDTGLRDMNSVYSPTNGWAIYNGYAWLRRYGNIVECTLDLNGASATNALVQTNMIPSGFRPSRNQYFPGAYNSSGGAVRLMEITTAGTVSVLAYGAGLMYNQVTWMTADAWPTTLPGTAIGAIAQ